MFVDCVPDGSSRNGCTECNPSIECDFDNGCACGYVFKSSNVNDRWFIYADGLVDNSTSSEYIGMHAYYLLLSL